MRIMQGKNILCTFRVKTAPVYVEKSMNKGVAWMHCSGSTRLSDEQGNAADYTYPLKIFGDAAITASQTILPGALLLVGGRTDAYEGKKRDYISILVDFWMPIVQDPYNYAAVIKAQMEMLTQMHLGKFYTALSGADDEEDNEEDVSRKDGRKRKKGDDAGDA